MTIELRLAANRFVIDDEPHITAVGLSPADRRLLILLCPAGVFAEAGDGLAVEHAACLECGACSAACRASGFTWRYPRGGMGVAYREG